MAAYEEKRSAPRSDGHTSSQGGQHGGQPPRRKKRRGGMGPWGAVLYVILVIGVSALLAGVGWVAACDVLALNKADQEATITLPESIFTPDQVKNDSGDLITVSRADVGYVADELKDAGLIEQPLLFKLFVSFTHKDTTMRPGTYTLDTSMDYSALIRNLGSKVPSKVEVSVTIPEGSTSAQIFKLLEDSGVATVADLEETAANYDFKFSFLQGVIPLGEANRLEGYLFPDTYKFYENMDTVKVLNKMLLRFDEVFTKDMRTQAEANGQTIQDIVIIASLIEKETTGDDQVLISSVLYNRIYKSNSETAGYLNIDATIQYILPTRKEKLTAADLAIDSPYNTYLYQGLPAGPIASPGQASLRAAMNPDDTAYYFYALGDDGEHHFFKTDAGQREFRSTQELYKSNG